MPSIVLARGESGDLLWTLTIFAELKDGFWRGRDVAVKGKKADAEFVAAQATLQTEIAIPAILVKNEAELKTRAEIETDASKEQRVFVIELGFGDEERVAAGGKKILHDHDRIHAAAALRIG